jgi:hypothetical protein
MNYWHLTLIIAVCLACGALAYAIARSPRLPEALEALGYRGPRALLRGFLREAFWTLVAIIGLVLLGALMKYIGSP